MVSIDTTYVNKCDALNRILDAVLIPCLRGCFPVFPHVVVIKAALVLIVTVLVALVAQDVFKVTPCLLTVVSPLPVLIEHHLCFVGVDGGTLVSLSRVILVVQHEFIGVRDAPRVFILLYQHE